MKSLEDKAKELQEENERLKEQLIDAKGIRHLVKDPYNESFYPTFDENSEAYKEAWRMYKGMKCAGMLHCEWDMCTVDFFIYFYMAGRKQALKDMMERLEPHFFKMNPRCDPIIEVYWIKKYKEDLGK